MKLHKDDIISYFILGLIILLNLVLMIVYKLPVFDFFVSITGIIYVAVLAERNMYNFLFGFINVILYMILSFQSGLYGEVILYSAFDIPMQIISFIAWNKSLKNNLKESGYGNVQSKRLKPYFYFILPVAVAVFTFGFGLFLKLIGGSFVFIDALSSGVTIIATLLLWKQYFEQWFMWIIVYVVSVILWSSVGNVLMIVMSAACLMFSIKGFVEWLIYSKEKTSSKTK